MRVRFCAFDFISDPIYVMCAGYNIYVNEMLFELRSIVPNAHIHAQNTYIQCNPIQSNPIPLTHNGI